MIGEVVVVGVLVVVGELENEVVGELVRVDVVIVVVTVVEVVYVDVGVVLQIPQVCAQCTA